MTAPRCAVHIVTLQEGVTGEIFPKLPGGLWDKMKACMNVNTTST